MTKRKRTKGKTNNDLQNTTHKTKDRVTRSPLKPWDEQGSSGKGSSCRSTSGTRRVILVIGRHQMIIHAQYEFNNVCSF